MKSIWKYVLKETSVQEIVMPKLHRILSIQLQNGEITMWVEVNKQSHGEVCRIEMLATGENFPLNYKGNYIGTIQKRNYVWHYYEIV